jgi:Glycosyl hydrolase family 46
MKATTWLSDGAAAVPALVLPELARVTGISDAIVYSAMLALTNKAEQDSVTWYLDSKGESIYGYAEALPYDRKQRGLTIGLFGATTADAGKDGKGDAMDLFKRFAALKGEDFTPYAKNLTHDKAACDLLAKKIRSIATDPKWQQAQWQQLLATNGNGYLFEAVAILKNLGFTTFAPLTLAAVYDCCMNMGPQKSKYGARWVVSQLPQTDLTSEDTFLRAFCTARSKVAAKGGANSNEQNGFHRSMQYITLLDSGCKDLKNQTALENAMSWNLS